MDQSHDSDPQDNQAFDLGWDNFDFNMPPEFVLPLTLYNLVMTSEKLSDEAKEHWANGQKHFWKREKTNVKRFISKTSKKPVLH